MAPPGLILGSCCCLPDEIWAHRPQSSRLSPNFELLVAPPGLILGSCCCLPDEIWAHRPQPSRLSPNFELLVAPPGLILGSCCCLPDKMPTGLRQPPAAGNPGYPQGPWDWLPEKERTLQNRQILSFCGVPSISAVPEAGNAGNPQLLCHVKFCHKIKGLEHILGRSRGGPFSKMWPPLNGHMDSHSSSFSGATHKERPGLPHKG